MENAKRPEASAGDMNERDSVPPIGIVRSLPEEAVEEIEFGLAEFEIDDEEEEIEGARSFVEYDDDEGTFSGFPFRESKQIP